MAITNQNVYDLLMRIYQRQERLSFDEHKPTAITVVAGTLLSGDVNSLAQRDLVYLRVEEINADPGLVVEAEFSPPIGSVPHGVHIVGRYEGSPSHHIDILAYNFQTDVWDDLSATEQLEMRNQSTDDLLYEYHLTPDHVDTDGTVLVRLAHDPTAGTNAGHVLNLDKVWLSVIGGEHAAGIVMPTLAGTITQSYALSAQGLNLVRGDSHRLTFNLGGDRTGWTPYFAIRKRDTGHYTVQAKQAVWVNQSLGTGYVDISALENSTLGVLDGEIELRNGDERATALKCTITVIDDVVK